MSQQQQFFEGSPIADLETLSGDAGGAIQGDAAFNITLVGGANITTTGNGVAHTITIDLTDTTNHSVQIGNAGGSLTSLAPMTNGQLVIGNTGNDPSVAGMTNGNNITWTGGAGTLRADLTGTTNHTIQIGNAGGSLTSLAVAGNGQIPIGSVGADPVIGNITSADGSLTIANGPGTIDMTVNFGNQLQIFYVGKHGNDLNSGRNIEHAFLTFNAARLAAVALAPSAVNRFVIKCFDEGIYVENITCVSYVDIEATNATITGTITCADNSDVMLHALNVATGTIGVSKLAGGTSYSNIEIDIITCSGTGIGFLGLSGALLCRWKEMYVVDGIGVGDITSAAAHMHVFGGDIYISGNGIGMARANAGTIVGHVDHIVNTGAGTPTGITVLAGTIDVNVNKIDTTTAFNVNGANSTLNLFANSISGTETIAAGGRVDRLTLNDGSNHLRLDCASDAHLFYNTVNQFIYAGINGGNKNFRFGNHAGTTSFNIDLGTGGFSVTGNTPNLIIDSVTDGAILFPTTSNFLGYLSATVNNVTGDGTIYQLPINSEVFDAHADFNTGTYTFTAPLTGKYLLGCVYRVTGFVAGINLQEIYMVTSNRTYYVFTEGNDPLTITRSMGMILADMDAADTCIWKYIASGGGKVLDITGGNNNYTFVYASLQA